MNDCPECGGLDNSCMSCMVDQLRTDREANGDAYIQEGVPKRPRGSVLKEGKNFPREKPKCSTGHVRIDGLGLKPGSWGMFFAWVGFAIFWIAIIGIYALQIYIGITKQ